MKLLVKQSTPDKLTSGLVVLPVITTESAKPTKTKKDSSYKLWQGFEKDSKSLAETCDKLADEKLTNRLLRTEFKPKADSQLTANVFKKSGKTTIDYSYLLYGFSHDSLEENDKLDQWRNAGGHAYKKAHALKEPTVSLIVDNIPEAKRPLVAEAFFEGALLAAYNFETYKKAASKQTVVEVTVCSSSQPSSALKLTATRAKAIADATNFCRDLVNTGPSDLIPKDLVKAAKKITGTKSSGMTTSVMTKTQLKQLGANALLSVSQGSASEPFLIHIKTPAIKSKKSLRVVLVGKGVTFDSGGLSIKTSQGMAEMKCDMGGAAAVLGVMHALASLPKSERPKHEIHCLVPTVENLISATSTKPGDVVRALNGKTVEILNTDAEGRLILADAISYSKRLKPDIIIDAATLTGACIVALGSQYAGLFTDDSKLRAELLDAAAASGENIWPLPLAKEYRKDLDSDIADLKNIGSGHPGATTAALFLKEFVPEGTRWAHLDIAGPAFVTFSSAYNPKGGTGFAVRTLLRFLENLES